MADNVDTTIGNLGLTGKEEDQIVAFLRTLTDGYTYPYTDGNSFRPSHATTSSSRK